MAASSPFYDGMDLEIAAVHSPSLAQLRFPESGLLMTTTLLTVGMDLADLHWHKLGASATKELKYGGPNAGFKLVAAEYKAWWPFEKFEDWPGAIGIYRCTRNSPMWMTKFLMVRAYHRGTVVVKMQAEYTKNPSWFLKITFMSAVTGNNMFDEGTEFTEARDMSMTSVMEVFFQKLKVPDHIKNSYRFLSDVNHRRKMLTVTSWAAARQSLGQYFDKEDISTPVVSSDESSDEETTSESGRVKRKVLRK